MPTATQYGERYKELEWWEDHLERILDATDPEDKETLEQLEKVRKEMDCLVELMEKAAEQEDLEAGSEGIVL